jgi:hypothetical protein
MISLQVVVRQRDFSLRPLPYRVQFKVDRYSWSAVGGPLEARIQVIGEDAALWDTLALLRCPVEILDPYGLPVWVGYIHAAEAKVTAALTVGVTLETMANRVQVAYSFVAAGSDSVGERKTTTAATAPASIATFGTKETMVSIGGATTEQAEALRNRILEQRQLPGPIVNIGTISPEKRATLICRGWWSTLDWQLYANTAKNGVATTTQIANIIAAKGQFFTGVRVVNASGVTSSEYRDGDQTALAEVKALLESGTINNRRLLARVGFNRQVEIFEEPASSSAPWLLEASGRLLDPKYLPANLYSCPVGFWLGLKDVIPPYVAAAYLLKPTPMFIEETTYYPDTNRLELRARDVPSPYDLLKVIQ